MQVVVDTSVIVAVVLREKQSDALVQATASADLLAPPSVHWEVGNALSAMLKRRRLSLRTAHRALAAYAQIPIRFSDVDLNQAVEAAEKLDLYAYDAYVIVCALQHRCLLMSLDRGLTAAAARVGVRILEVGP